MFKARLYQRVYSDENLTEAWHKVKSNSDAAGIDGVTVPQFQRYLFSNLKALQRDLQKGAYRPQPVKYIYMPKSDGSKRPLGILTVRDRIAQRAVLNIIEPLFEADFENSSYGFRPGRSVQMALDHLGFLVNQGYLWAVKLDIHQCFESINLVKLQKLIKRKIKDRRLRKLIHGWLVTEHMQPSERRTVGKAKLTGLLQGSPLSPLLANIYLDQFDKMARRKNLYTIRYADDIIILCPTHKAAKKALKKASKIIASIDLSLNLHKTRLLHVEEGLSFLGAALKFQTDEDGDSRWIPSFPESEEELESSEPGGKAVEPDDLKYLLKEVRRHRDGHPIYH